MGDAVVTVSGLNLILRPQERRVVELVGEGLSNKEVAELMNLSIGTAKVYLSRAMHKLKFTHRRQVIILYWQDRVTMLESRLALYETPAGTA